MTKDLSTKNLITLVVLAMRTVIAFASTKNPDDRRVMEGFNMYFT
ncbi:hypothetical protein ACFLU6_15870 [Acidobacteriota bacterium]